MHNHDPSDSVEHAGSHGLPLALAITIAMVVIEGAAGWYANSLALITDAAHNLTDVGALALTWYALKLTQRPPNAHRTYGYHRAGILVALINSGTLVLISLGILYEAYLRLKSPPEVQGTVMVVVSLLGLVVNLGAAWFIRGGRESDLNLQSSFVHLAGDAAASFGALIAGIGIAFTGWLALDPLASMLIGVLILFSSWEILRESVSILLESTPHDLDVNALVDDLCAIPGVRGVHDLHVWSLSKNLRALSAHVLTDDIRVSQGARIQEEINRVLVGKYDIGHSALQLECAGCEPDALYCDLQTRQEVSNRLDNSGV